MLNIMVSPYNICDHGEKYAMQIVKYLKKEQQEYSVYFSKTIEDFESDSKSLSASGETEFVVVGDDFILSRFLNSVADISKIKLGIIPTSRKDNFSSYLGISSNPVQAIKDILTRNVEAVDYLLVGGKKVINEILIGASAEVYDAYHQSNSKNVLSKQLSIAKYGKKFSGISLTFDIKGKKQMTEDVFEMSVSNGGLCQKKNISPLANLSDGLFNFNYCVIDETINKKKYLNLFKSGEQIYDEHTRQFWVNNLKISNPDNKIKAVVDAEVMTFERMDISIVENGLKIYKAK